MGASQRDNGTSKAFMRNTRDLDALGGVRTMQAAISLEAAVEEFTPPLTHTHFSSPSQSIGKRGQKVNFRFSIIWEGGVM